MRGLFDIQRCAMAATALAACALLAPTTASAAAFTNGGFDNGGPCLFDITVPTVAPTGWLGGGPLGNMNLFCERAGTFTATVANGSNAIGFGGNGQAGATLSQTFDTVAGDVYTVEFFTTAQQVGGGAQSFLLEALNGAGLLGSVGGSIPEVNDNWTVHSLTFTAGGASSTLRFTDTSNGRDAGGINWALDAVSVSSRPGSTTGGGTVPEPGTLALLGLAAVAWRAGRSVRR